MKTSTAAVSYKRHRYPAEIIAHAIWLYYRFSLSFRDVEELMAARGVILSYETVRRWTLTFGQQYANDLRHRRPQPGDKWHLDEVLLSNGVALVRSARTGMVCSSPSMGKRTTCGGPSTRMASSSIFSSKAGGINKQPRNSSANC